MDPDLNRDEASSEYKDFVSPPDLTPQESVLALAMLQENPASVIGYSSDGAAKKLYGLGPDDFPALLEKFKASPRNTLTYGRLNVMAIPADKNIKGEARARRTGRYIDAYLSLQIKLDKAAFPPNPEVKQGVPEYIPDGLTDMGSDDEVDPALRSREKIRVDKEKYFQQAKPLFNEIFSMDWTQKSIREFKEYVVKRVAEFVNTEMPYNYNNKHELEDVQESIGIAEVQERHLAVCRHHALATQVLLEAFGLTSRLLKCRLNSFDGRGFGSHAANLVRINRQWNVLDVTNPDRQSGYKEVFLRPIPEKDIDLNETDYEWDFKEEDNRIYRSRHNMFYKITGNP